MSSGSSSGPHPAWQITVGDLVETCDDTDVDRVVLDMLAPWETLEVVAGALVPGGVVCGYVATTTQLSRLVEGLREHGGFTEPQSWETLIRGWHVDGLAVRPEHRMIGHTGFLVTSRRLAPGVSRPSAAATAFQRRATGGVSTGGSAGPKDKAGYRLGAPSAVTSEEVPVASRDDAEIRAAKFEKESQELATALGFLEDEVASLRRRLSDSPRQVRGLEERLSEAQASLAGVVSQNERLVSTLKEARDQIVALKEEVDRLAQPPSGYGYYLATHDDDTVDVFSGGRKLRVSVSPAIELADLKRGQEVMLNEAMNVVKALAFERQGDVVLLKEVLESGDRALVVGHTDEERDRHARRAAARRPAAPRRLAARREPLRLGLRADPEVRGRGPGSRGGPGHRLRGHRRAARPDRADP